MGIEISTQLIHASIAQVLHEIVPEAEIFDNPNQQGTPYPAWFIVHRSPTEIKREIRRYYLTYYIDIWYMIQQNITQMFDKYTVIGEQLADKLEYIPLYGYPGVVLHTFETSWSIEMTAMKYSLTIRLVCSREGAMLPKMEVIEDFQVFLKGLGKIKRIRYVCTQFTDFDMGIETLQYCRVGDSVVLPFVGGIYRDGDNTRWEPLSWNVGPFGGEYGPITDDVTIDLVMGVVVGFDVCIGGTVGVGSNLGSDIVWRLTDMSRDAWHYVGPELVLDDVIVIGGDDLSRDAYEYVGPQKNLGPSPVLGGTVEPYNPTVELPTVMDLGWYGISQATIIRVGEATDAITQSGQKIEYDRSKVRAISEFSPSYYPSYGNPTDLFGLAWTQTGTDPFCACVRNIASSGGGTTFSSARIFECLDSSVLVIQVYASMTKKQNAFKFTADGADYYYVLDGIQTEWTDDLASIGYSLEPATHYIDVFFYFKSDGGLVAFSANDYWASCVIDDADQATLTSFGVPLYLASNNKYVVSRSASADFSFEPIGLYSGVRTGELIADMSNFYCGEASMVQEGSIYYGICIKSRSAYSTNSATWKCRITRL